MQALLRQLERVMQSCPITDSQGLCGTDVNSGIEGHTIDKKILLSKYEAHEEGRRREERKRVPLQSDGLRRLYCGPSRTIKRPTMMKYAASRGVGAMMVDDILVIHVTPLGRSMEAMSAPNVRTVSKRGWTICHRSSSTSIVPTSLRLLLGQREQR